MKVNIDPVRNRPADEGKNEDPYVRDDSAVQPGVNTISSSDTDTENEQLTKTGNDSFRTESGNDEGADPAFDEIDKS